MAQLGSMAEHGGELVLQLGNLLFQLCLFFNSLLNCLFFNCLQHGLSKHRNLILEQRTELQLFVERRLEQRDLASLLLIKFLNCLQSLLQLDYDGVRHAVSIALQLSGCGPLILFGRLLSFCCSVLV